ncbi:MULTISPECIES: glycosyltransferase family 2 protein [Aequorivita]|uniref:Glycosyltransferase n=2 Tax=Aequorivita TaxID=153265 RepID=A0AB35Z0S0_9FLAO|nr:glycosyltransferase [Aequorivita sp. Ant34-E75]WGF91292.1 glycosyltransferase [Aequorivita sp. Ant34-E75]
MISILIPTYNYNVFKLVASLHVQAKKLAIIFEINVYDDCSPNPVAENEAINSLENATYHKLKKNIGRSAIRNLLANNAKYENLLFLDADTQIIRADFLKKYLAAINKHTEIIYGGILYQSDPPPKSEILRWQYGKEREALPVPEREKQPHLRFLTLNFLIKKSVFSKLAFNEEIPNLRHEDTLFALDAKAKNIHVAHIDNPVIHLGLESSEIFLRKSRESVESLHSFVAQGLIKHNETALSKKAEVLKKYKLREVASVFYKTFKAAMEKNLLSSRPSLVIFDVYRLGYYLSL